jgi:hypothetical protein
LAITGQSAEASRTAGLGVRVRAGLEMADRDDLVPGPYSDGEGAGPVAQDGVGAVIGPLQGRDNATAVHPGEEARRLWELLWQLVACVMFARQRKSRSI